LAALVPSARDVAAAVPPSLAGSTIRGAVPIATVSASVTIAGSYPAQVIALTEGGLRSMLLTKLKLAVSGLLLLGLLVTGAGLRAGQENANKPGGTPASLPGAAPSNPSAIPARPSAAAAPEETPEEALKRRLVEIARRRLEAQQAY